MVSQRLCLERPIGEPTELTGEAFLRVLLVAAIGLERGDGHTVRAWIERAAGLVDGADALVANKVLASVGLKVLPDQNLGLHLVIPNFHTGLSHLLAGTAWAERFAATSTWTIAIRKLDVSQSVKRAIYFFGETSRAVAIPVSFALALDADATDYTDPGPHEDQSQPVGVQD